MPSKLTLVQNGVGQSESPGNITTTVSNNQMLHSSAENSGSAGSVHSNNTGANEPKRVRILCCANCKTETLETE